MTIENMTEQADDVIDSTIQQSPSDDHQLEDDVHITDHDIEQPSLDESNVDVNNDDDEENEVIVSIGEPESSPEQNEENKEKHNSNWIKELRKQHRESQKKIREYEALLKEKEAAQVQQKTVELKARPKLEDFDYDSEEYDKAVDNWYAHKREYEAHLEQQKREEQAQQNAWNDRLSHYSKVKSELKVNDFDDAEYEVQNLLSQTQQGIIVQGAENPALLVYALGKNPKKSVELASITDPVKFAFAVAKIEKELKMTPRKSPPPPEKTVSSGSGRLAGTVDKTLERLRNEAERTGDYTNVIKYKNQLKNK